ncbi:putative bacteriodes thetaiotaomicron symbiotic chitinase [Ophiocordyceps camponoti-floridani]|uniref:Putative bacteriodes thetaiotaomicron symbiotic chitinase n=1 Tax=Ophiocordyceps camponoti-floridani TaxID=2030778 RepID=A0A8H4Q760_9HYPO|nr:putative bacteriodes thetaiotaomicron symbiotic chitinase [Ophiocordyceps camponoti-floridani]
MSNADLEQSDVVSYHSTQSLKPNNDNKQRRGRSSSEKGNEFGQEAQGFVMIDGPRSSIDHTFATAYTVVRQVAQVPNVKRSDVTSNKTLLESVFDPLEETFHVYCNYRSGSSECDRVWMNGAEDTIVLLPDHVGEGPFARLVSMKTIRGRVMLSGQARAGAHLNFGRAEVYWPQEDEASKKYEKLLGVESESSVPDRDILEPVFEADVELTAGLDITVQPQVSELIQGQKKTPNSQAT